MTSLRGRVDRARRACLALPRERVVVWLVVVALILFRSAMFVFERQLDFNSDEAVFGLMAKHLTELRAFPLFMYGQNYILAVEAWMAAPMFLLFGVSAAALKLPLLLINIAIGLLLVTLFERELGLRPMLGLVASLFFILAPPGTASPFLQANGGNVEPILYILLLWMTRRRPVWFGLILGIGFLHREFTMYGLLAVIGVELMQGALRDRERWMPLLKGLRLAAEVWLVVQFLRPFASVAGPGTMAAQLQSPANNLIELGNRLCVDPSTVAGGLGRLVTRHWPVLFGTARVPAVAFGLESPTYQGMPGASVLLGVLMLLLLVRIATHADRSAWPQRAFVIYLCIVGVVSPAIFVLARCGSVDSMRYDLLSLLGAVGLAGWWLSQERTRWIRRLGVALILAWTAVSAISHGALWAEYVGHRPQAAKQLIVKHLEARGIRYAHSDYWIAYYVTFMTNERIVVASDDFVRIEEYGRTVDAHRAESVYISRRPCGATLPVFDRVYFCPP